MFYEQNDEIFRFDDGNSIKEAHSIKHFNRIPTDIVGGYANGVDYRYRLFTKDNVLDWSPVPITTRMHMHCLETKVNKHYC